MTMVSKMQPEVAVLALATFVSLRAKTMSEWDHWSTDGRLKTAKVFLAQARSHKDFNLGMASGAALASAWLESSARISPQALEAFQLLEGLAREIEGRDAPVGRAKQINLARVVARQEHRNESPEPVLTRIPSTSQPTHSHFNRQVQATASSGIDPVRDARFLAAALPCILLVLQRARRGQPTSQDVLELIADLEKNEEESGSLSSFTYSARQLALATAYGVMRGVADQHMTSARSRMVFGYREIFGIEPGTSAELVALMRHEEITKTSPLGAAIARARKATNQYLRDGDPDGLAIVGEVTFGPRSDG